MKKHKNRLSHNLFLLLSKTLTGILINDNRKKMDYEAVLYFIYLFIMYLLISCILSHVIFI